MGEAINLSAPCLGRTPREATEDLIWLTLRMLPKQEENRFAILSSDDAFMQVLYTDDGRYILEWQAGRSVERHYRSLHALSLNDVTSAFLGFFKGETAWREGEFERLCPNTWTPVGRSNSTGFVISQVSIPRFLLLVSIIAYVMGYANLRFSGRLVRHKSEQNGYVIASAYEPYHQEYDLSHQSPETLAWIYAPLRWGESWCWEMQDQKVDSETDGNCPP
jgi:hypothetical protein